MIYFPNAKINLGLFITEKRNDGFHNIESVFYPVPWQDILEIIPSGEKTSFKSTGLDIPGNPDSNLVLKAYELLKKDFDLAPVQFHLHKQIPMGAGLGGGSADASFALRGLNEIFELELSDEQLENYASQLGSDCAFFVKNKPAFATGRGEILEEIPLNLTGKKLLLLNPSIHVPTALAYAGVKPFKREIDLKALVINTPIREWKGKVENDFERSVFQEHPLLAEIKEQFYALGADYSAMSGSGSTMLAIADEEFELPEHLKKFTHKWFEL